jgi:hypothetical protein
MSVDIRIHGNGLRMLSRVFLVVVPLSQGLLQVGAIYDCNMDPIGNMGKVECLRFHSIALSAIDERLNELTDHLPDHFDWYFSKGFFKTDTVQLGYFRFQYRSEDKFKKLLEVETKHVGINLKDQPNLFSL